MNTKYLIPIYLSNITLGKFIQEGDKNTLLTTVILEKKVVKGFNEKDIIKRRGYKFIKQAGKVRKKEHFKVLNIELLSQHGYGIND